MGKRKFDAVDGNDLSASKRQKSSQQDDLEGILDNGKKALYRALRVSKGFERQKLGRRQKTAKEQNESVESVRLAEEVTALKVSDPTTSMSWPNSSGLSETQSSISRRDPPLQDPSKIKASIHSPHVSKLDIKESQESTIQSRYRQCKRDREAVQLKPCQTSSRDYPWRCI